MKNPFMLAALLCAGACGGESELEAPEFEAEVEIEIPTDLPVTVKHDTAGSETIPQTDADVVACIPNCLGKVCGADGCGGSCGPCIGSCVNGIVCKPFEDEDIGATDDTAAPPVDLPVPTYTATGRFKVIPAVLSHIILYGWTCVGGTIAKDTQTGVTQLTGCIETIPLTPYAIWNVEQISATGMLPTQTILLPSCAQVQWWVDGSDQSGKVLFHFPSILAENQAYIDEFWVLTADGDGSGPPKVVTSKFGDDIDAVLETSCP